MSRTIHDLREVLFDTLEDFREKKILVEDVKAVCEIGQVLINTAKVEVDHLKVVGSCDPSTFLDDKQATGGGSLPNGVVGVRQHRIKG